MHRLDCPRSLVRALCVLPLAVGCADPCATSGITCTVVGTGSPGADFSQTEATLSPLYAPMDVAVRSGADDFFVADFNNHRIKLVQGTEVSTIIGTEFLGDGDPDFEERVAPGVAGTEVALNHPTQLEWNPTTERLLLPSWHNHRVREWNPETGLSLVVAANTDISDGNGANAGFAGDGGPAADALMGFPNSIAVDPDTGGFWLLAQKNQRIRWVEPDFSLIDTMAGTGDPGFEGDGGPATEATFFFWRADDLQPKPSGAVEYDGERYLYVADTANHAIRVIDTDDGTISTLPGTGTQTMPGGVCDPDALCYPRDVELGPGGLLWIADSENHVVRTYDLATEELATVAGTFEQANGEDGLPPLETALDRPYGLDIADDGTLLIADTYNHRIRKVTP